MRIDWVLYILILLQLKSLQCHNEACSSGSHSTLLLDLNTYITKYFVILTYILIIITSKSVTAIDQCYLTPHDVQSATIWCMAALFIIDSYLDCNQNCNNESKGCRCHIVKYTSHLTTGMNAKCSSTRYLYACDYDHCFVCQWLSLHKNSYLLFFCCMMWNHKSYLSVTYRRHHAYYVIIFMIFY